MGNVLTEPSRQTSLVGMADAPRPVDILWPDRERGPWRVTVWWRLQYGAATPVGFAIQGWADRVNESVDPQFAGAIPFPDDDAELPQVGSQLLRQVPIGQLLDATRPKLAQELGTAPDLAGFVPSGWETNERARVSREMREENSDLIQALSSKRGGRYLGVEHYREVARVYKDAVTQGKSPTKAVAEHFVVTKAAAAKKVARAREAGLLPKTTRGRQGPVSEEL